MKKRVFLFLGFAAAALGLSALQYRGIELLELSAGKSLVGYLRLVCLIAACYEMAVLIIASNVRRRKGAPSEVKMLGGLLRAVAILAGTLLFLFQLGKLTPTVGVAVAGFSAMLMGWSLQAPVSGVAAWVMINVKRPFRVGDRVMLPAWGLIGDVEQIGMMYTVLNQVGGTVGSEEAAGRLILIPNAMLFTNVVINYTPHQTAPVVLDEVVIRVTFDSNWERAERILLDAASEVTGDIIQQTGQRPYIRADMTYDYGVLMRLRYQTPATDRPRIAHEITKRVFRDFQRYPDVDFAIPYVYSSRAGARAGARHLEGPLEPRVMDVDINQIRDRAGVEASPDNVPQVKELAGKISQLGLLQPIVVEKGLDGEYRIVAGQLRLQACKMLGWRTIPAVVHSPSLPPA